MPFKSEAQRKFMHARHPDIAARWEKEEASGNYKPTHGSVVSSVAKSTEPGPGHGTAVRAVARKQAILNRMKKKRKKTRSNLSPGQEALKYGKP